MTARATRALPLGLCLILLAVALFHGEAQTDGMIPWLGAGALAAIVVLVAVCGMPGGTLALLPLAALTAWLALSIHWSAMPDRSWDYADRTFVYLAFAVLGLWLAGRTLELAYGLAALLGAVVLWSLGGKVLPLGALPVIGVRSRLDAPVGLWNQLALLGDFAIPLALWLAGRLRTAGTLLAYAWGVAIVLTLSRGGLAVAVLVVVAWLVLADDRWSDAVTVVAAGVPAAAVAAVAFALPGVTGNSPTHAQRWHDGLIFGALLLAGAAVSLGLARMPRPQASPALRRVLLALAALAVAAFAVAAALKAGSAWRSFTSSTEVGNQGPRFSASSNFRWTWWREAWDGFEHHVLAGTGAGSFGVTNLRYRTSYLDVTTEPHDLPVQFLSETGLVGLGLFLLSAIAFLRGGLRRRGHELALALVLPAYLLHGLVDIDWDFVAVSVPAFLVAGALVGRPAVRRAPAFAALTAAGAALLAFAVLLLPWLGERWANEAQWATSPKAQNADAKRARSVDPFILESYWAQANAADTERKPFLAIAYYGLATQRQPQSAQAWNQKAEYELGIGCPRMALADFYRFNSLDPYENPIYGPNDYRRALALVNSGKPIC